MITACTRLMGMALTLATAYLPGHALAESRASSGLDGRSVAITGDRESNYVQVMFDAEGNAIEVSIDGATAGRFAADQVEAIRIRLLGGDDVLNLDLRDASALRRLDVSLGAGDDTAVARVAPGVRLDVAGGAGLDGVKPGASPGRLRSVERRGTEPVERAAKGGGGSGGSRYHCNGGICECDKSIENDCEDMTAECTDDSVDGVIACINGWLTTGCTCKQIPAPRPKLPIGKVKGGKKVKGSVTGSTPGTKGSTTGIKGAGSIGAVGGAAVRRF